MLKIGVIGYGKRINAIANLLIEDAECEIFAIADVDVERVKTRFPGLKENVKYYRGAEEMLKSEKLDGVLIGTRCSTHTKYAVLVSEYGLPLFLEKPVCTTYDDLERLKKLSDMDLRTVVSFPLRTSLIVERVKEIIESGRIGKLTQIQSANNVPYGANYFHKWYRNATETGGMFLQKATHDLDFISYIIGLSPVRVAALKSQSVYGGDKTPGHRCKDCPDAENCPETPKVKAAAIDTEIYDYCSFARDVTIEDCGSMLVEYKGGIHAVYTQNFVVREGAAKRGARFIGYKATLEFDFYTGEIHVFDHYTGEHEVITVKDDGSHFGGDKFLTDAFIKVMKNGEPSPSPLSGGIASAEVCLAAKYSAENGVFVEIK